MSDDEVSVSGNTNPIVRSTKPAPDDDVIELSGDEEEEEPSLRNTEVSDDEVSGIANPIVRSTKPARDVIDEVSGNIDPIVRSTEQARYGEVIELSGDEEDKEVDSAPPGTGVATGLPRHWTKVATPTWQKKQDPETTITSTASRALCAGYLPF